MNEVLDMSKLESGEIVLEEVGFNIDKLSDETIGIVEELAKERNIQIVEEEKSITHPYLMGSPIHVKRVLMNVLSNAIKYNRDNGFIYVSYSLVEIQVLVCLKNSRTKSLSLLPKNIWEVVLNMWGQVWVCQSQKALLKRWVDPLRLQVKKVWVLNL